MNERYEELDSLRGLAALSVFFSHIVEDYNSTPLDSIQNTPIRILWSGPEAVLLFFVLSGFVLSLPFYRQRNVEYTPYLIKRVFRIYGPYIVSIGVAILMYSLFARGGIPELSKAFNEKWNTPIDVGLIFNHIFLIGEFDTKAFNNPIWSLVHEMRISIIFPLLMFFIIKYNWKSSLSMALLLPLVGGIFIKATKIDFFETLLYCSCFMYGALLARWRVQLVAITTKLPVYQMWLLFAVAVSAFTYSYWIPASIPLVHNYMIRLVVISLSSCVFIALSMTLFRGVLRKKPLVFMGRISYSFYLYHLIVIYSVMYGFYGNAPLWVVISMIVVCAFAVSSLAYYFVERPFIEVGKKVANRIQKKRTTNQAEVLAS